MTATVRRRALIDLTWPESEPGLPSGPLVLLAEAVDRVTSDDGVCRTVDQAGLEIELDTQRVVTALRSTPDRPELADLVGRSGGSGWRGAAQQLVPGGTGTALGQLLDDVPVALLVSGYAALQAGRIAEALAPPPTLALHMRDVCAGWATGATPLRSVDAGGPIPVPAPVTVTVTVSDGADEPLLPGRLRRSRRLSVTRDGSGIAVDAWFRDSWCAADGVEGALHEYQVRLTADPDFVVTTVTAEPAVLPYDECPRAAASPARLIGRPLAGLGSDVPRLLSGPSTCTHLNDLLRSLAAVPNLVDSLR